MLRRSITALTLLSIISTSLVSAQETARFKEINKTFLSPDSKIVMITAHRGVHNECPENSLPSFQKGIDLGIDIIELDIRHTKDDSLVIMHDKTVDRMTNGTGEVASLTFEEIRKLRLKYNGQVTNEKVPTLEEALTLAKGKILVDLDIKTNRFEAIMNTVTRTHTENTVFFLVYKAIYAKMIKEKNPVFKTLIRSNNEAAIDSIFAVTKTEAIHIDDTHNTIAATSKIKKNGARSFINALDDADKKAVAGDTEAYGELLKNGANIIQTNNPALLMQYLKSKHLYY